MLLTEVGSSYENLWRSSNQDMETSDMEFQKWRFEKMAENGGPEMALLPVVYTCTYYRPSYFCHKFNLIF